MSYQHSRGLLKSILPGNAVDAGRERDTSLSGEKQRPAVRGAMTDNETAESTDNNTAESDDVDVLNATKTDDEGDGIVTRLRLPQQQPLSQVIQIMKIAQCEMRIIAHVALSHKCRHGRTTPHPHSQRSNSLFWTMYSAKLKIGSLDKPKTDCPGLTCKMCV